MYKDYGYDNIQPDHIDAYLMPQLIKLLSKEKNIKILDVGCGNGWLARNLLALGYDVYGTDASETGIQMAKVSHPDRFFVQDITTNILPIQLQHIEFDTVISTEVIEHLYNPTDYLEFCYRILAKNTIGGEIIISTPYHGYFKNLILALTNKMDSHFTALWNGGHIKFWSQKTIYSILKSTNFEPIAFEGCGRLPYIWKSMIVKAKVLK